MERKQTIITYITSILLALVLLILAVKITLNFRPLYYFDIHFLKITETNNMSATEIKGNYDALITYLTTHKDTKLVLPTLPMSVEGEIHFEDVKNIFLTLDYVMYLSLVLSIPSIIYLYKQKAYHFYKLCYRFLLGLPLLLLFPLLIDFNTFFTIFHKIAFTNDYWLFDPETDPIINLLPQRFFMHSALLILIIIIIESILLSFLYRYHISSYVKKTIKSK
jgi:integral membrane protein (TIGR01906 family)